LFGVSKNGNQKVSEAVITLIVVVVVNVLNLLPEKAIPTFLDLYIALRQAIVTAFTLYALNKGIEWKRSKTEPTPQ